MTSLKLQTQFRKRSVLKGDFSEFVPERLLELCEDDERQITRLNFLVENMLDLSKLTSGNFGLKLEPVNINELVQDIVHRMKALLNQSGSKCEVETRGEGKVIWDRLRIEQVVTNLLSNAGKYAPVTPVKLIVAHHGTIAVESAEGKGAIFVVTLSIDAHGSEVKVDG